jgi:uncharacterized protein (TIGR03435 family)
MRLARTLLAAALPLVLLPVLLHSQGQKKPEFEVASIKPAPLQPIGRTSVHMSSDRSTGNLTYSNVSLRDLIGQAYKLQSYQISGPEWLNDVRFDIAAKFEPGSSSEQFEQMHQSLLDDRFHLKFHRETKELPIYALTIAKGGSKLKPSDTSGQSSSNSNGNRVHLEAKVTLTKFAEYLSQRTDRPVLNQTGLDGSYEITLDYARDEGLDAKGDATVPSLFTAIQEQLGLKLEGAKGPIESLVVDSADRTPTEN